ncbi:hypothetical protein B0H63DRAFT_194764 [Podospora didyma]|uniref:Uncharacterized protein n=1 Tax=Podospora didyma TaxID=330526 RepID=A0AAE0TVJ4_9PEZI|nr:hypothetical protein B0H63DRAFT_194764 [Podospora didyma]
MKLGRIFTALSLLLVAGTTTAAPVVEERVPLIGAFSVSEVAGCPLGPPLNTFQIALGDGCGDCRKFYNGTVYRSIDRYWFNAYCIITLFQTTTCSDPGIVSGPGCWTPEGGIAGYKVTCPWWPEDSYFKGCMH